METCDVAISYSQCWSCSEVVVLQIWDVVSVSFSSSVCSVVLRSVLRGVVETCESGGGSGSRAWCVPADSVGL